jgi:hypothetical protein
VTRKPCRPVPRVAEPGRGEGGGGYPIHSGRGEGGGAPRGRRGVAEPGPPGAPPACCACCPLRVRPAARAAHTQEFKKWFLIKALDGSFGFIAPNLQRCVSFKNFHFKIGMQGGLQRGSTGIQSRCGPGPAATQLCGSPHGPQPARENDRERFELLGIIHHYRCLVRAVTVSRSDTVPGAGST